MAETNIKKPTRAMISHRFPTRTVAVLLAEALFERESVATNTDDLSLASPGGYP
jgi:hypothetical protein